MSSGLGILTGIAVFVAAGNAFIAWRGLKLDPKSHREQFFDDQGQQTYLNEWSRNHGRPDAHRFFGMIVRK